MKINKIIAIVLFVLGLNMSFVNAFAGMISVDSGFISMAASEKITSLVIHNDNDDNQALSVQINCIKWTQNNGKNIYTPTYDLLVTPPIFSIPANSKQIIRIGMIKTSDPNKETMYKLQIKQIASKLKTKDTVQIVMQFNIPIMLQPIIEHKNVKFLIKQIVDNQVIITIENKGNVHFSFHNIELKSIQNDKTLLNESMNGCVLAEQTMEIKIPIQKLKINNTDINTDKFKVDIT